MKKVAGICVGQWGNQVKLREPDDVKVGPWTGATSESIALCANRDGLGVVLKCAGKSIRDEFDDVGSGLEDMGLDKAPNGISIWEGTYRWCGDPGDGETEPEGKFRKLTPDEWQRLAQTGVPWSIDV